MKLSTFLNNRFSSVSKVSLRKTTITAVEATLLADRRPKLRKFYTRATMPSKLIRIIDHGATGERKTVLAAFVKVSFGYFSLRPTHFGLFRAERSHRFLFPCGKHLIGRKSIAVGDD